MIFLNPEIQLKNTEFAFKIRWKHLLNEIRGLKFVITLVIKLKEIKYESKYSTFYSNSKAETVIHNADIDSIFESICSMIVTKMWKFQAEGLGWDIDSVIEQNINVKMQTFNQ